MIQTIIEKWQEILEAVKEDQALPDVSYNIWLLPLKPVSVTDNVLTILYKGEDVGAKYIKDRYGLFLKTTIATITGTNLDLNIVTSLENAAGLQSSGNNVPKTSFGNHLNPKFTFDTFVVGNSNSVAHAASLAVAESPAEAYNPLFIYGGVGLGKTHLMHAIALFILKHNPSARVVYTSCESFNNDLIEAIRTKSSSSFREKYRNVDVLIIDDIQFMSKGEYIQEEIFNTFNYLYDSNKQIVFASDRPPREIENLDERIRSRFLQGLPVEITHPDFETRMAILRKKEEVEGYNIDNEVITYIATMIKSNNRELEAALKKVVSYSKLTNKDVTLELAKETLKDHISDTVEKELTPEYITEVVAEHFGIRVSDLASEKRSKELAYPRHIAMYLCCELTGSSLAGVAKALGKKDHSTVIHGRDKISAELKSNDSVRSTIDILKKKLSPGG